MNAQQIEAIARTAVEKAREHSDRNPIDYGIEAQVQAALTTEGYIWTGTLDGTDRSIRAVAASLKRDMQAGKITEVDYSDLF
jgi:hypothetical protein